VNANRLTLLAVALVTWVIAGCADPGRQKESKTYRGNVPVATVKPDTFAPLVKPREVPISGPKITCGPDDLLQVEGEVDNTTAPDLPFVFVHIQEGEDADMTALTINSATGASTMAGEGRGKYEAKLNAPQKPGKYTVIVQWADRYVARSSLVVTKPRDAAPQVPR
jgi:hypothetical protein